MRFDLYVWREDQPITATEARVKLERWGEGGRDLFATWPAVVQFYDVLLDRFPPLGSLSEDDIDRLGVWSTLPQEFGVGDETWKRRHPWLAL